MKLKEWFGKNKIGALGGGLVILAALLGIVLFSKKQAEPAQVMVRVTIPEGLRKEQYADLIGDKLNWNKQTKAEWIKTATAMTFDSVEGVYFPDTYLIPKDETPLMVAKRLKNNFEEKFAPFAEEALKQNIQWTTLLTIASLIQREAAGDGDMALISGIIWNRLDANMNLDIDATLQYARDTRDNYPNDPCSNPASELSKQGLCRENDFIISRAPYEGEAGWWKPIKPEDKQISSPYNTYLFKGLPPRPIANPGLLAIKAVLYPEKTKCLYYIHDKSGQIHCAETLSGHKENLEKYY